MTCKGCKLTGCQRRDNPPAGCLIVGDETASGAEYWPQVRRMAMQEQAMRMDMCEGGD